METVYIFKTARFMLEKDDETKQFEALVSLTRQYQPEAIAVMETVLVSTLENYIAASHSEGIANTETKLAVLRRHKI